jgi:Flp pilus assembly protein TadD
LVISEVVKIDGRESPPQVPPALAAAIAHLKAGDAQAALRAASDACHAAPRLPAAHYAYGQAWAALGETGRAERAFAEAVRLAPRWADAWINYGLARYRQGAIEDAKVAMTRVLGFAPGHAIATSNLAAFARISGGAELAEALLREQIARQPDDIGARLNLAAEFLQEERAAEALECLAGVEAPSDPNAYQHFVLQRALALLLLRRSGEARGALDALEARGPLRQALAPLAHWRRALLANLIGDNEEARREADLMEGALTVMGPEAVPEHAIMARFDLAKFWSGQGQASRAFAHWREGHALLKRTQPFSRDAHRAFVDANIAHLSAERFRSGPRAGNADPRPVFIVGMPRSGTTLCEQIIAAHRDAHGAGERSALGRAFARLGGADTEAAVVRLAGLDAPALDAAADAYLSEFAALAPGKSRIVDKMPGNYLYVGLVGLMLPGARIIHCERDPRDVGLSIFTFRFHGHHAYAHDLADLGWTIGEHDRIMRHWKAALPNPVLTVRLSDWVEDFEATLVRVLTHLDLPADPACTRFHERESRIRTVSFAQVRQPVNARGLGRWRAYAVELQPLIVELEVARALDAWP